MRITLDLLSFQIYRKKFTLLLGKTLDYSVSSLKDLDLLIEHVKTHFLNLKNEGKLSEQTLQKASVSIGCYLGEVIRQTYGGTWVAKNDFLKVLVINDKKVSPILYIYERLYKDSEYALEYYLSDIAQDFSNPIVEAESNMTTPEEPQKNPVEYSSEQVQPQSGISEIQQNPNPPNIYNWGNEFLANWFKTILEEQRKQTKLLSNISTAATFFIILTIIGFIVGFCRAIGSF